MECGLFMWKLYIPSTTNTDYNNLNYESEFLKSTLIFYPKNLKGKKNNPLFNPLFIILLDNKPRFCVPEHKPSVYSTWNIQIKLKFSEYMQNISRPKSFGKFVLIV